MRKGIIVFLLAIVGLSACKKNNGGTPTDINIEPQKPVLNFPEKDAACNSGTVVSATQTTVVFSWKSVTNATSYTVTLKNLLNNVITTQVAGTNQADITLLRNTPYSWYVVARSNTGVISQSDVWKFFNSGEGVQSHMPFPAEVILPAFGTTVNTANSSVNLSWKGADVDDDISVYDVYFGTTTSPALFKAGVTASILENVPVSSKTTYYWKVVTKDLLGNTSDSELFQFQTQ